MTRAAVLVLIVGAFLGACFSYNPIGAEDGSTDSHVGDARLDGARLDGAQEDAAKPLLTDKVDVLFVVHNGSSAAAFQANLTQGFPDLLDGLKGQGSLPDLHIGVVSADLGAGPFTDPSTCEKLGGDGGKLQVAARVTGCIPPDDAWISHVQGLTNVSGSGSAEEKLGNAFSCIAPLGDSGCGWGQPLEAARQALDPAKNVNPGFMRQDALLAVVLLDYFDDCSAADTSLFDPNPNVLGQPGRIRCIRYGLVCDEDLQSEGPKHNCKPGLSYLYTVSDYVSFFKGLKPPGQVFLAALGGPETPFELSKVSSPEEILEINASCMSAVGKAYPGVRLKAVAGAFGETGIFNKGILSSGGSLSDVPICASDYRPLLRLLGEKVRSELKP